jgi:transposase
MKTYSLDLRERVLKDVDAGMATSAVASKYSVSTAWVRCLKQRRNATGQNGPTPQKRGVTPSWITYPDQFREAVQKAPDATLAENRERFRLPYSRSALARALIMLGLSRKKSLLPELWLSNLYINEGTALTLVGPLDVLSIRYE